MSHQLFHNSDDQYMACTHFRREALSRYNLRTCWLRCSGAAKIYWPCLEYLLHSRNLRGPCSHPSWLHRLWLASSTLVRYSGFPDSPPNHYHCHLVWTILGFSMRLLAIACRLSLREACHLRPQPPRPSANLYQYRFEPSPRRVSLFLSQRSCFLCQLLSVLTLLGPLCLSIYHLSGCRLLQRVSPRGEPFAPQLAQLIVL